MILPNDFVEHIRPLLGEDTEAFLSSYQNRELHGLRFRNEETMNAVFSAADLPEHEKLLEQLGLLNQEAVSWAPLSFYYDADARPGLLALHEMGIYYIQEPSAMGPAALLAPNPGERVLDLCAAPGGKTTELAVYMKNQGLLVSNEIHPARAKILSSNVERMGISNALVLNEDSNKLKDYFGSFFHRILVDAPCSGEGMFRKNPDAIGEWSLENVKMCAARQAEILDNAAQMLMPGGTMVYSTCTFAREENEDTIDAFLQRHSDFQLIQQKRFWPHLEKGEGHYMALLKKAGELSEHKALSNGAKLDKGKEKLVLSFIEENLNEETAKALKEQAAENGYITFGDQIFLAPPQCPSIRGLKVQRAGLALGEIKKDRFEPSHALALYLKPKMAKRFYGLTKEEATSYIRGEAIQGRMLEQADMGWGILSYMDFSVGWGKASGSQIKNHYPKGLRKQL